MHAYLKHNTNFALPVLNSDVESIYIALNGGFLGPVITDYCDTSQNIILKALDTSGKPGGPWCTHLRMDNSNLMASASVVDQNSCGRQYMTLPWFRYLDMKIPVAFGVNFRGMQVIRSIGYTKGIMWAEALLPVTHFYTDAFTKKMPHMPSQALRGEFQPSGQFLFHIRVHDVVHWLIKFRRRRNKQYGPFTAFVIHNPHNLYSDMVWYI